MDVRIPELEILLIDFEPDDLVEYQAAEQEFHISVPSQDPVLIVEISGQIDELRVFPSRLKVRISRAWMARMAAMLPPSER